MKQTTSNEKGESLHSGNSTKLNFLRQASTMEKDFSSLPYHHVFAVRRRICWVPAQTLIFLLVFTHQFMSIYADQNLHRLISEECPLIINLWGSTVKPEVSFSKHRICIQFLANRWQFFINTTWRSASCRCFLFSCLYLPSK